MNTYMKRFIRKNSPLKNLLNDLEIDKYLNYKKTRDNEEFYKKVGIISGITIAGTALMATYPLFIRPWYMNWGSNDDEIRRYMAGDERIENPDYITTRSITIHAKPEQIWPWLIETGLEQNGLGIYEWLDKTFGFKSVLHIEPTKRVDGEMKQESSKRVSLSKDLPVQKLEQYQNIVLGRQENSFGWTLAIGLYPLNQTSTRMVIRTRMRLPRDIKSRTLNLFMDPASFVMIRKWLMNIKNKSEIAAEEEYEEAEETTVGDIDSESID